MDCRPASIDMLVFWQAMSHLRIAGNTSLQKGTYNQD